MLDACEVWTTESLILDYFEHEFGNSSNYSGTSIIRTPLGPHQIVLIIEVSLVPRLVHNTAVMLYLVDTIKYSTYKQDIRVKVKFCL